MTNNLRYLLLSNFKPTTMPLDVVEIDVVYKESNSPNIYTVCSHKKDDLPDIDDSIKNESRLITSVPLIGCHFNGLNKLKQEKIMCDMTMTVIKNDEEKSTLATEVSKFRVENNGINCWLPQGEERFIENIAIVEADMYDRQLIVQDRI